MVDTGASVVAMNPRTAERLKLKYRTEKPPVTVLTASGEAKGYPVILNELSIGEIRLDRVQGMVIDAEGQDEVLLGMTALRSLKLTTHEGQIILEQKR